jgi:hypothetical protein
MANRPLSLLEPVDDLDEGLDEEGGELLMRGNFGATTSPPKDGGPSLPPPSASATDFFVRKLRGKVR